MIIWLTNKDLIHQQQEQIDLRGGSHGLQDENLLKPALASPKNAWNYHCSSLDVIALASYYGYHLVKSHPFVDGNKRIALVATFTFLLLNGCDNIDNFSNDEAYVIFDNLASGRVDREMLEVWLRKTLEK